MSVFQGYAPVQYGEKETRKWNKTIIITFMFFFFVSNNYYITDNG